MTEKDLRSLSKLELLEMLRQQELEIEQLTVEKEESEKQLDDRRLSIDNAGSIAEASVLLSGVMKAAQEAADVYLENVKTLESEKIAMAEKLEQESMDRVAVIFSEAERRRAEAENETRQILENINRILSWFSSQLSVMHNGFHEAVIKLGMQDAVKDVEPLPLNPAQSAQRAAPQAQTQTQTPQRVPQELVPKSPPQAAPQSQTQKASQAAAPQTSQSAQRVAPQQAPQSPPPRAPQQAPTQAPTQAPQPAPQSAQRVSPQQPSQGIQQTTPQQAPPNQPPRAPQQATQSQMPSTLQQAPQSNG